VYYGTQITAFDIKGCQLPVKSLPSVRKWNPELCNLAALAKAIKVMRFGGQQSIQAQCHLNVKLQ